jgi:hypothetical protein
MQLSYMGVPEQRGTWNDLGATGSVPADRQQIRFCPLEQSLSCMQVLAQVAAQVPLQQIGVALVVAQSADEVHAVGHGVSEGVRQSPGAARFGSRACVVVQQASPLEALQPTSEKHEIGQSPGAVQMGFA